MFPFPGPFPGPPPMGPPPTDLWGKTIYKYTTPDGKPPLDGAVPTVPPGFQPMNPMMPGGNCVPGAIHPFGPPNPYAAPLPPCPFGLPGWAPPPAPFFAAPAPPAPPPYYTVAAPPPPPAPPAPPAPPPGPPMPPPPGHPFGSSDEPPEPPMSGNRLNNQLATFPDRSVGYIFSKRNIGLHVFKENIITKHAPGAQAGGVLEVDGDRFMTQYASASMTFEELIEQLDCRSRANHYPPYNQPGKGYPEHCIGLQELIRLDDTRYQIGARIVLTDYNAKRKLGDLWPSSAGTAGGSEPRYIVRLPV